MKFTNQQGMSLVEMIVVLAVFTILSVVIVSLITSFYRYNAYTIAQAYQVDSARRGVDRLVRDLREMTYSDNGAFPLVSAATSSITFYSDIDRDDSVELVTYELIENTLYKKVYEASGNPAIYPSVPTRTEIVSEYVHNILEGVNLFVYHNSNGDIVTATNVTEPKQIEISLVVNVDPIQEPGKYHLRSSASLRNLKEYDF